MRLVFAPKAERDLCALDPQIRHRILRKLEWFVRADDPLVFAEPISEHKIAEWRFRIGDWRVLFDATDAHIIILRIGHRREIYR